MTATVDYLPIWKKGATPEERFQELAMMARKHPERFTRMVLVYEGDLPLKPGETYPHTEVRYATLGMSNTQALGLLEVGKDKIMRWMFDGED